MVMIMKSHKGRMNYLEDTSMVWIQWDFQWRRRSCGIYPAMYSVESLERMVLYGTYVSHSVTMMRAGTALVSQAIQSKNSQMQCKPSAHCKNTQSIAQRLQEFSVFVNGLLRPWRSHRYMPLQHQK